MSYVITIVTDNIKDVEFIEEVINEAKGDEFIDKEVSFDYEETLNNFA
jgi:hypothetical protein